MRINLLNTQKMTILQLLQLPKKNRMIAYLKKERITDYDKKLKQNNYCFVCLLSCSRVKDNRIPFHIYTAAFVSEWQNNFDSF